MKLTCPACKELLGRPYRSAQVDGTDTTELRVRYYKCECGETHKVTVAMSYSGTVFGYEKATSSKP
jgi:hypothetical protein